MTAIMRTVFLRFPVLRALLAFGLIITCYLYIRINDVTGERHITKRNIHKVIGDQATRNLQNKKPEGFSTLQDGFRMEILYGSSPNDEIMIRTHRESLEVEDIRRRSLNVLPQCNTPNKIPVHSDNIILDTLRFCGNRESYSYEPELETWLYDIRVACTARFVGYGKQVALLKDVIVDRSKCNSLKNGGERLEEVIRDGDISSYREQFCRFKPGFFSLACPEKFHFQFKGDKDSYLAEYMDSLGIFNDTAYVDDYEQSPTVVLTRYEYHNIYHTMAEIYNAFIATVFLQTNPKETNVVLIDAHPRDNLDFIWKKLFHSGRRINDLPQRTLHKRLLWTIPGHSSFLLNYDGAAPPYLDDFVEFILNGYSIRRRPFPRDCSKLRVVLIWRDDYVSNVRNPSGVIDRKIGNEIELLAALRRRFPMFVVQGLHMEQLHINTQLHKMARTDLLIGMHGAGLTHALFLPKKSGIIELIPKYWNKADGHFRGLARWRGLEYARWVNTDPDNENVDKRVTYVPPDEVINVVEQVVNGMCGSERS